MQVIYLVVEILIDNSSLRLSYSCVSDRPPSVVVRLVPLRPLFHYLCRIYTRYLDSSQNIDLGKHSPHLPLLSFLVLDEFFPIGNTGPVSI